MTRFYLGIFAFGQLWLFLVSRFARPTMWTSPELVRFSVALFSSSYEDDEDVMFVLK